MPNFREIAFGYTSAEAERSHDPGLLVEGYVDLRDASEKAIHDHRYLFLGHKGSGKSAIAERMELILAENPNAFVRLVSLADFPFTPFSKIIRGSAEPETKFPTAWSWILLIYLLESFDKDAGLLHPDLAALHDAISAFRKMGLSPASDPGTIVRQSAKKNFQLALPGKLATFSWSGSETRPANKIPDFVESLKSLISRVRSQSKHYLIIDGLDEILTSREVQYKSISALIFEVNRLNGALTQAEVPAKIILLCRTDLFERIPGANKNKIRQDCAVELDWYRDPREPAASELVKIAQIRTTRSLGAHVDLFKHFLPSSIERHKNGIATSLLDMTRHTPRDFLRLLHHIQQFSNQKTKVTHREIMSGMREYSIKYFLPEIQDELSGYANPDEISSLVDALGRLRKRDFGLKELVSSTKSTIKPLSDDRIYDIIRALFQCSAIGNLQRRPGGTTHYTFKYRNRHSSYNEGEDIILHRGLWKALNLI